MRRWFQYLGATACTTAMVACGAGEPSDSEEQATKQQESVSSAGTEDSNTAETT